jgi:dihydropteroate synthase
MMSHAARVISTGDPHALEAEIAAVGAPDTDATRAAMLRPVRLEEITGPAAALLRQEMLVLGGDCMIHRAVADFDPSPRPVLLLGTAATYERLVERAALLPHGVAEAAAEAVAAVGHFEQLDNRLLKCRDRTLELGAQTLVMGIINLTPDSFSGDGLGGDADAALAQALSFIEAGCDIVDVGGQSTRPGSAAVSVDEELERVLPVVELLADESDAVISIDTNKPEVARLATAAGAGLVNDVNGLRDPEMIDAIGASGAAACVMHMKGTPETMQQEAVYDDLIGEIYGFLSAQVEAAEEAGLPRDRLLVDPGFGFGKTPRHNLELLRRLRELRSLGCGVLIGTSRKSTIGQVLDLPADQRVMGTAATCAIAIANGADVIRVHDVPEMVQVARMSDAIVRGWGAAS